MNYCRNLIKKPRANNPQNSRIHIRHPNKGPRFLNQVPTLHDLPTSSSRKTDTPKSKPESRHGLGFRVSAPVALIAYGIVGALIIRIGFWGHYTIITIRNQQNSIGIYLGPL